MLQNVVDNPTALEVYAGDAIIYHVPVTCEMNKFCDLTVVLTGDSTDVLGKNNLHKLHSHA